MHDLQIAIADHVDVDDRLHRASVPSSLPALRQMPAAVQAVALGPVLDGLLAVQPNEVKIVFSGFAAEQARHLQQESHFDEPPSFAPTNTRSAMIFRVVVAGDYHGRLSALPLILAMMLFIRFGPIGVCAVNDILLDLHSRKREACP